MPFKSATKENVTGPRVERRGDGTGRIDVTGPAIVRTPAGADYEVGALTLAFPNDSEVWFRVWPTVHQA